jgi:hypothetical protein
MGVLTAVEQQNIKSSIRQRYPNDPETKIRISEALEGSYLVVLKTLGETWANKNFSPTPNKTNPGFMRRGLSTEQERLEHVDRVVMLAEFIDKLWDVPNFSDKLRDLQTKSLEETFFELQIARSLLSRGSLAGFVVPSGVRAKDYDLIARIEDQMVAVEIKCRTAEGPFNENQLTDPLKHAARTQLPKDGPGIIFLKLSSAWLGELDFLARADRLVENFLRNYSRINAVFLHWEEWNNLGGFARINCFKSYINVKPKKRVSGLEKLDTSSPLTLSAGTLLPISFI